MMNRYSRCNSGALRTIALAAVITVLGLPGTLSISSAQADPSTGTSQDICGTSSGPAGIRVAASQAISYQHFTLLENQPGTIGAAATAGNLVFAVDNGARLRAVTITGTNSAYVPASAANGDRVFTTGGNGNAALPDAAAGTGQIVLGGVTFTSSYMVDGGADTLTISNDAGVAPTAVDSSAATAGSDLTYGEYAAALADAIYSVFRANATSTRVTAATGNGSNGIVAYANLNAASPATLALDPNAALTGGDAVISISGGLTAVTATTNIAPTKFIDGNFKLVAPFTYASGTKTTQLTLTNIVLDTRYAPAGSSVYLQLDPATTASGVTIGTKTLIAVLSTDFTTIPIACSNTSLGPITDRTMVMQVYVDPETAGRTGNYYAAAQLTDGQWYFMNSEGNFVLYTGGPFPILASGTLSDRGILVLSHENVAPFAGATIYAGFGVDETDLRYSRAEVR